MHFAYSAIFTLHSLHVKPKDLTRFSRQPGEASQGGMSKQDSSSHVFLSSRPEGMGRRPFRRANTPWANGKKKLGGCGDSRQAFAAHCTPPYFLAYWHLSGVTGQGCNARDWRCYQTLSHPYRSFSFPVSNTNNPHTHTRKHASTHVDKHGQRPGSPLNCRRNCGLPMSAPSWPLASHSGLWVGKAGRVTVSKPPMVEQWVA